MIVKYNSLDRLEDPVLTLCNPGSVYTNGALTKVIGTLIDHTAEEIVYNFNAPSELNFRVNKVRHNSTRDNEWAATLYNAIRNRRLVFVDDVGYFVITSVKTGFDGEKDYKDVTAQSIEKEIEQRNIPYVADGTYSFVYSPLGKRINSSMQWEATVPEGKEVISPWINGDINTRVIYYGNDYLPDIVHSASGTATFSGKPDYKFRVGVPNPNMFSSVWDDYTQPVNYYVCPITLEQGKKYTAHVSLKSGHTALSEGVVGIVKAGDRYTDFVKPSPWYWIYNGAITSATATYTIDSTWTDPHLVLALPNGQTTFNNIFNTYEIQLEEGETPTRYVPYSAENKWYPSQDPAGIWYPYGDNTTWAPASEAETSFRIVVQGTEVPVPVIENDDALINEVVQVREPSEGILNKIVESLPLWTCHYAADVDQTVAERFRTFEDVDTSQNCYAFLMDELQDKYDCIIEYDTINRKIYVYDRATYPERNQTDVHITKRDVIDSLDITENADDLYTALTVYGADNLSINAINPTGSSTIYRFDNFYDMMTGGANGRLATALKAWQQRIDLLINSDPTDDSQQDPPVIIDGQYYAGTYAWNLQQYYAYQAWISNLESEMKRIQGLLKVYQGLYDNIQAAQSVDADTVENYNEYFESNGGTEVDISQDVDATLTAITGLIGRYSDEYETVFDDYTAAKTWLRSREKYLDYIHDQMRLDNWLANYPSPPEHGYEEVQHFIFEGNYTDDTVIVTSNMTFEQRFEQMKLLYDRSKERLAIVSEPTQDFDVDVESFLFDSEFVRWSEQLKTGCIIHVELEQDNVVDLFLTAISVNYDDHKMSLTFGNRYNKTDTQSLFDDMLGNVTKTANTVEVLKGKDKLLSGTSVRNQQDINNASGTSMADSDSARVKTTIVECNDVAQTPGSSPPIYPLHTVPSNVNPIAFTIVSSSATSPPIIGLYYNDASTSRTLYGIGVTGGNISVKIKVAYYSSDGSYNSSNS